MGDADAAPLGKTGAPLPLSDETAAPEGRLDVSL